jgi:chromosome segregation ATPase
VPPRKAGTTQPPPLPPQVANKSGSVPAIGVANKSGSVPAIGVANKSGSVQAMPPGAPSAAPYVSRQETSQPVPRGEWGEDGTAIEPEKLRVAHHQATIKRDPASALLEIPEAPLTTVKETPVEVLLTESAQHGRDDATSIDPKTSKFERGDPTSLGASDPAMPAARPRVGRLRTVAALRRQRGWFGDVRYVATVMFGVRRARRELAELELKQESRQAERERYLVTLGRTAVITDNLHHPALGPARERLAEVEDERARHRSQVGAADEELQRVTRDREAKAKQYTTDVASLDAELAELAKRLEPLQKEHASATRRAADLRETLRRIDAQIQETTASLVAVRSKKDPAAIQAELATLKADREGTKRDEPKLAQELDSLSPRIAAIEAKRAESTKRRAEMIKAEEADKGRSEELLAAIGAKRKVMDRAANDAEELRDKILFELAERLYVDRPKELGSQLAPIDAIDVELGSADRRVMELREIMSSIDRRKLFRGIAMIAGAVLFVGGFVGWILWMSL